MPIVEIFLAVFIFILIVLVSIEDISTGFLLLLLLMPLQHKELFSLIVWDVLPIRVAFFGILLTTFYRFYLWFRRYKKTETVLKFIKDPVLILLALLYLVRLASIILVAENKMAGFKLLAFYTTVVYFYLLIKFLYSKYQFAPIRKALTVYALIGSVTGLFAAIQYFSFLLFKTKFGAIWDIPGHRPRVGSTYWDVNHFAAFISSVIPLSASYIFVKRGYTRLFWILNTIFLCGILYITQSRSSWMGLAASSSVFVVFLMLKGYKKYAKIVVVFCIIGILGALSYFQFLGPGVAQKYKSFMHTRLDSFDTHFILVEGAMEVYRDNPWLGKGYGNFNEAFRETSYSDEYFFREKNIINQRVPSHSIWGEVASETGFFGIATYVLLFFTILAFTFYGFLSSKSRESFIALGTSTGILALLISGIFYTYNLEFFWILSFLSVVTGYYFGGDITSPRLLSWLSRSKRLPLYFVILFSSFFLFWDLGKNKLIAWDEAIYAAVSKNMFLGGDYFTPQWTLHFPWFEKPPLYFWLSSFFMNIFGVSEFSARLPSAILGLVGVIAVYKFANYIFKSRLAGLLASLMLVTTGHYLYYSRLAMLDVSAAALIILSLYFGYKYFNGEDDKNILWSGLFGALAIMIKAIVGLLPFGILGLFGLILVFKKQSSFNMFFKGMLAYFFTIILVVTPWHVFMYLYHGKTFIDTYFITHMLNRGLTSQQGKTQPFFWYIDVIRVSFRGWYLVLIPSILYASYKAFKFSKQYLFLLISCIIIFVFFSSSNSKLAWYIIPLYPVLVLINAGFLLKCVEVCEKYINKNLFGFSIRYISAISFPLLLMLYFVNFQKVVYFPDFNKDLVKSIEVYNDRFFKEATSINKLYYLRIDSPVVMFYSDGPIAQTDTIPLKDLVDNSSYTKSFVYLSRVGEVDYFHDLYGGNRVQVKYNSGSYYLTQIRSREELATAEIIDLTTDITSQITAYEVEEITPERLTSIREKQKQLYEMEMARHLELPLKYPEPVLIYYSYPF